MSHSNPVLSPGTIKGIESENRFVLAPMSRASAADDGTPTNNMADYYRAFAEGGFGLLIAEGAFTDNTHSQSYSNQPGMVTQAHMEGWKDVVSAVKNVGGKIILQLIHAGAVSQHVTETCAPSAIRPMGEMLQGYGHRQGRYDVPRAMGGEDIARTKDGFVRAAILAEQAGFHGVEIHCANGYLLDQFLTEYSNSRNDRYGGALENRVRLTCEVISEAKAKVSSDFIVGVRLSQAKANNSDYFWPNGEVDARVIFQSVAKAGADYIHIASEAKGYEHHSYTNDGTSLTALARELTGLPIIANGGLHDTGLANQIIRNEEADFVAIGKTALMNPDLPKKVMSNKAITEFTFDAFSRGVSIEAQATWEHENGSP